MKSIMNQNIMNFSEQDLISLFPFSTKENPTLIDVGGHVGSSSLPFAQKGWRIVVFEPEPENRSQLEENLQPYDNVTIVPKAVSNQTGEKVPFYVSKEHWGIHSLKPYHESHQPELKVDTVRLDETLRELNINEVTFLKIDIEGADFFSITKF
jgi:FkbM family methyltransferase